MHGSQVTRMVMSVVTLPTGHEVVWSDEMVKKTNIRGAQVSRDHTVVNVSLMEDMCTGIIYTH